MINLSNLPKKVLIREVMPRDGLQNIATTIPTETKIEMINRLNNCGIEIMEVTSFSHPKWIPQLSDAEEVVKGINKNPGTSHVALVPNIKGVERAIKTGDLDGIGITMSVSETHNNKNLSMSRKDSMQHAKEAFKLATANGLDFVGGAATAFGCPMEGRIPFEELKWVVGNYADLGIKTIRLGDSTGMANPVQVFESFSKLRELFPEVTFNFHGHNTRDMGLANVIGCLQAGVTFFDGAIGGLGGCPYAPNATGNIDTIDLVHLMHQMDIETGIDLDKLIEVGRFVEEVMGRELHSTVLRAGTVQDLSGSDVIDKGQFN